MWTLTKLFVAGAIAFLWFQSLTPRPDGMPDAASTASAPKAAVETTAKVEPAEPVITVRGICENGKDDATPCATIITREQFENLKRALHSGSEMPAKARNNLGKLYAEYITVEAATRKAGMEDTPEFREFTNWMRVLAASEYYRRKLEEKLDNRPQDEIDAYYREHLAEYEKAKVLRVLVPRQNPSAPNADEFDKNAHEVANTAQAKLASGTDAAEVQKNVYAALGLQSPPPVDLGTQRRKDFLADESADLFSLKAGEASQVHTEPRSYVIYKLVSKETTPEEDLKKSISAQITQKKFEEAMKSVLDAAAVDLNEQYFGPPGASDAEPRISPHTVVAH